MSFSIFDVLIIFEALQIFFLQIPLKMGKNEEDLEFSIFFEAHKYYFVFESRLIFFQMVKFLRLFRRCPKLLKSTLKMTTCFRCCLTLFNSTVIWRCPMLRRRDITLKTMLSRCWNHCWYVCVSILSLIAFQKL